MCRSAPSRPLWDKVKGAVSFGDDADKSGKYEVAWSHTCPAEGDTLFFAFTYP